MIRQEQEQEDDEESSSHEAIQTGHQGSEEYIALIACTTESSSLIQLAPTAGGTMDSDDNYSSPGDDDEGDQDDEGNDKTFSNKNASSHFSLDASPGGIDRLANFPLKLHKMLERAEIEGFQTTVSWLQPPSLGDQPMISGTEQGKSSIDNMDGRRSYTPFKVHNPEKFVQDVIPRFFQMTKFKSFLRQLNIWGFSRDRSKGAFNGSYYHKDFVRQDPDLCQKMRRTKNKGMYKRGTKGSSSPLNKSTTRSPAKIGLITTSFLAKDVVASNKEDLKRAESSVSTTSHSANEEIGRATHHPDLTSMLNRDLLTRAARNNSAPFPIAYRPTMRGMERQQDQFFGGDLQGHADPRQMLDGLSSSQQQQIFLRGATEASMLSEFSLSGPTISRAANSSVTNQDTSGDRQNSMVYPPPLPTPSSREISPRIHAQGGTSTYASAIHQTSARPITNWSQGLQEGGERQGDVFSLNVARGGQSNASAVPPGSVVGQGWRSGPFVPSSSSSLQKDISTSPRAAAMPRSDKIAQLLTNPQMAREDLKYILVGFHLGAANKEEDDLSHADSSSLGGVVEMTTEPDDDEHDPSPIQKMKSASR